MSSRVLTTDDGKFVAVRNLKLCAVDSQQFENDKNTVTIRYHKDVEKNWIAFKFNIKKDAEMTEYILQAKQSSLELVQLNQPDEVDEVDGYSQSAWFEKVGISEHYCVRVAGSTNKYFCIKDSKPAFFFLSDNINDLAKVRDEPV